MLDEDHNWAIDIAGLKVSLEESKEHCDPRIMVVINPGNPTGKKMDIQHQCTVHASVTYSSLCTLCDIANEKEYLFMTEIPFLLK